MMDLQPGKPLFCLNADPQTVFIVYPKYLQIWHKGTMSWFWASEFFLLVPHIDMTVLHCFLYSSCTVVAHKIGKIIGFHQIEM